MEPPGANKPFSTFSLRLLRLELACCPVILWYLGIDLLDWRGSGVPGLPMAWGKGPDRVTKDGEFPC